MDISFIIVSWNAKDYLDKCVASIKKDIKNLQYEIIVVDNNSSDGSQELIKKTYPDVILIEKKENLGFAKANNIGIKQSKGKYLYLVNSDVEILDNCINNIFDYLENHNNIGMLGPKIFNPDMSIQATVRPHPTLFSTFLDALGLIKITSYKKHNYNISKEVDILGGCFWAIRKKAINDIGVLDENFFIYGEDMDWCIRFCQSKWKVFFYSNATSIHFGGASSINSPIRFYLEMHKANFKYWKKYHHTLTFPIYKGLILMHHSLRFSGNVFLFLMFKILFKKSSLLYKIEKNFYTILYILNFTPMLKGLGIYDKK